MAPGLPPLESMAKLVYVAGPLFSEADRMFLEHMVHALANTAGLDPLADFFLPHRDSGELREGVSAAHIFHLDLQMLEAADLVVALLDGQDSDSGTCVELGYAYARGKKIMGLLTDSRVSTGPSAKPDRPNIMVWGICEGGRTLYRDLRSLSEAFATFIATRGHR